MPLKKSFFASPTKFSTVFGASSPYSSTSISPSDVLITAVYVTVGSGSAASGLPVPPRTAAAPPIRPIAMMIALMIVLIGLNILLIVVVDYLVATVALFWGVGSSLILMVTIVAG